MTCRSYHIEAVIFDFDGTLTLPGAIDFSYLKQVIACPEAMAVLEFIDAIEDSGQRQMVMDQLDEFEMHAAAASRPNPGAQALVRWIKEHNLFTGILTRNSRKSVLAALLNFDELAASDFDLILTRDDPVAVKPSGDGIQLAAERWGLAPCEILMVGDFLFDIQAGSDAQALTALLDPLDDPQLAAAPCDFRIRQLSDLKQIIQQGLAFGSGKLPNDCLQAYLREFNFQDPSVIVSAGVGEDVAAVDIADEEVLVLKSDPITFATDAIGQYAVIVNANDIVTAGAKPRWFLTTLLLPCGTTPSQIRSMMQELAQVCDHWGITLCGGHTEISDAVRRPVVVGMMAGTVKRCDLIEKHDMQSGDTVVLTKAVAVEGTAIIAREFVDQLLDKGITSAEIEEGKAFLSQISILPEARLVTRDGLAVTMHDVTEGGLATALEELSTAGAHRIAVDLDAIPIFDLTRKICTAMDLDPLGLIGSGSLVICCRSGNGDRVVHRLRAQGIEATVIGKVLAPGQGIEAVFQGKPAAWPRFKADEITRLFGQNKSQTKAKEV